MPSIALPDVREMRTPDLHALRAGSATECLQPLAATVLRESLCRGCPLVVVCTEIHNRETAAGAYAVETTTATPAPASIAAGAPAARRGIRPALGWKGRRLGAAVRAADTGPGGDRR